MSDPPLPDPPAPELVIADLATLKVVLDPLRIRILQALLETPRTVKHLAAELGVRQTTLYHHIKVLEAHGLIRVAETHFVRHLLEKSYQSVARRFTLGRTNLAAPLRSPEHVAAPTVEATLALALETISADVQQSIQAGPVDQGAAAPPAAVFALHYHLAPLTPEQAATFALRVHTLAEEFAQTAADPATTPPYGLAVLLYPSAAARRVAAALQ